MCGIVGFSGSFAPELIAEANQWQGHRGPDDRGDYIDREAGVGLGYVRLAILDQRIGQQQGGARVPVLGHRLQQRPSMGDRTGRPEPGQQRGPDPQPCGLVQGFLDEGGPVIRLEGVDEEPAPAPAPAQTPADTTE